MKYISIFIGKIVAKLCVMIGRGSAFPGTVSKMIDKNILKKFILPEKIIVVTGSSGKGSTTRIIANGLREAGYTVAHNKEGGNETSGVITTLLKNCGLNGKIKTQAIVLEMDERYIKYVVPIIKPSDIVITNITRDQPPRQRHTDFIIDEINNGLTEDAHLYLNANDPILQKFLKDRKNEATYYGIDKLSTSYKKNMFNSLNCPRCIKCNHKLKYDYYLIEDLGSYKCSNEKCDFKEPKAKYMITGYDDCRITINNKYNITLNNDMLYNFYNTLAAFSVLAEQNLDKDKIAQAIENQNRDKKVYNKYSVKGRRVFVLNNKCENASTYNQSMLYTYQSKEKKTIVIGWEEISRRYLWDDLSWLYDIEFELFNKQDIDKIIVCGPQRYDLAVRLKYAGISDDKIKIHKDLYEAKDDIESSQGDIYGILNFDYVNDFNRVMEELK